MAFGALWHKVILPAVVLSIAAGLLLAFSLQYPLSADFPLGGDAAIHITTAQTVLNTAAEPRETISLLRQSKYPLSHFLLAGTRLLPLSWPDRFMWWAAAGQALAGLALGGLLWRVADWRAAAAGMIIWALSAVGVGNHFEDGTIPQLWSLVFMILAFERLAAGSGRGMLVLTALALAAHFLTGLVLVLALTMGTAAVLPLRRRLPAADATQAGLPARQAVMMKYLLLITAAVLVFALYRLLAGISWPAVGQQSADFFLLDVLRSKFAPWVVISLPGLALLVNHLRRRLPATTVLLSFLWLSLLLTNNSALTGSGMWENRFRTYLIVSISLAAGLALPKLVRAALPWRPARAVFVVLLLASFSFTTWRDNSAVYGYYNNPDNRARLHPQVRAAIDWMDLSLPAGSYVASSGATRYAEWIPALSGLRWGALDYSHPLLGGLGESTQPNPDAYPYSHLIFLKHHEDLPYYLNQSPENYKIVYENQSVVIIKLP